MLNKDSFKFFCGSTTATQQWQQRCSNEERQHAAISSPTATACFVSQQLGVPFITAAAYRLKQQCSNTTSTYDSNIISITRYGNDSSSAQQNQLSLHPKQHGSFKVAAMAHNSGNMQLQIFINSFIHSSINLHSNEAQQINGSNQRQQLYSAPSAARLQSASYVAAQWQLGNGFNSSRSAQHFRQRLQHHGTQQQGIVRLAAHGWQELGWAAKGEELVLRQDGSRRFQQRGRGAWLLAARSEQIRLQRQQIWLQQRRRRGGNLAGGVAETAGGEGAGGGSGRTSLGGGLGRTSLGQAGL
ncbi:hypothetical protein J5N97_003185 [Dioscorea zingiberensis]|uniref:Uncharacterized protein n=1 Tax=Dioscorea zingiberensis TaxID=325984 RepID=A0A9D5HQ43_9LILI|nr:hypothetical protein J5N97_003185 [Dioscorea zingiberensis]